MRLLVLIGLVFGLALPDLALANNLLWQQNQRNMMMQQQRMQQQRMQQQRMQQQRAQQQRMQQQRAQQERMRQARQAQMRQRQAQMQARQQQIRVQQQKIQKQRQLQQQKRKANLAKRNATPAVATRNVSAATARSAQIARNQIISRERQRRMAEMNKKSRLKRQFDKAAKDRETTASVAMLLRRGTAAARVDTRNRFNSSSSKLRTLGPKFDAAKTRTEATANKQAAKQRADQIIAEFKRRQATRGAKETLQDFKSAARPFQPKVVFKNAAGAPPRTDLTRSFKNAAGSPPPPSKPNLRTTDAFNKATGNRALTPKPKILESNRIVKPAPKTNSDTARRIPDRQHAANALRRAREIPGRTAVLGRYPEYKGVGKLADTHRFVIRNERYNSMSTVMQWRFNKRFLDRQISNKSRIVLSTPIKQAAPGSLYAREIAYLRNKGYRVSKDGLEMVKP